jgi:hypothetical protein
MRQVTVILKGIHSIRKSTIGEGTLRSLPPGAPMAPLLRSQSLGVGLSTLDYEGEVRANSDVTVGQFVMNRLQVRVRIPLGLLIGISHVAGFHDALPRTTEPIYVTAESPATRAPHSPRHGLFYGHFRARKSRLMILCILPVTSQLYSTCPPYPPYLLVSICALVHFYRIHLNITLPRTA